MASDGWRCARQREPVRRSERRRGCATRRGGDRVCFARNGSQTDRHASTRVEEVTQLARVSKDERAVGSTLTLVDHDGGRRATGRVHQTGVERW